MKRIPPMLAALIAPMLAFAADNPGFYRFPAIHGDTVAFTAEGDLWKVSINGGVAQRLTTHHGMESHAAFSPDGQWIAFGAQYEGPTEAYVMPAEGGLPRRLTWEGESAEVVGWTPDGDVLYSTRKYSTLPNRQLAAIDPEDRQPRIFPLHQAHRGVIDPSDSMLYFTRLPRQSSATKRYKGGTIQQIWKFPLSENAGEVREAQPLTGDFAGTGKDPMVWNGRVYFASDRDGTMNLWSMNKDGGDLRQHTRHKYFDIQSPKQQGGRVVYHRGADLHLYDIAADEDRVIPVSLSSDFDQTRERWIKEPMDYLAAAHISPDGENVALTARGLVFVKPVKGGRLKQAADKPGVRYRNARFMPNGRELVLQSDESGEIEFELHPANGIGDATPITTGAVIFRNAGVPSPDGEWLAHTDRNHALWLTDANTRETHLAHQGIMGTPYDPAWSPDGKHLAFVDAAANTFDRIFIHSVENRATYPLTGDRLNSHSPAWSRDGKWLYYLASTNLQNRVGSPWGAYQPDPFLDEYDKIHAIALQTGAEFPFQPPNELTERETGMDKEEKAGNDDIDGATDAEEPPVPAIDWKGLLERVYEVPVPSGNYNGLELTEDRILLLERRGPFEYSSDLKFIKIQREDVKLETMAEDVSNVELSANGKTVLLRKNNRFYAIPADAGANAKLEDAIDLSGWTFTITPREEWRQMFIEAWRLERDYFYDPNLHGVDYGEMLQRHLPLADRVSDRAELSNLIEQIVGELSALHIAVRGGDLREGDDNIAPASLGAVFEKMDEGFRIKHIYQSDPDYPGERSPLNRPGLSIAEGDVLVAVNGSPLTDEPHPGRLLRNQAGKQTLLRIRSAESGGEFEAVTEPISPGREADLRYDEWEYTRRLMTEQLSGGRIGYVHLRAMGGGNYVEWARNYFPEYAKPGLIIDMRHNRGGNIDSWVLGELLRQAWFYWKPRAGRGIWNMQYAFRGHKAVLCNEFTASDGEAFAEGFKRLGLGEAIGTRTWGGEIWLSINNRLVDRGYASAAQTGVYGPEGEWLIEGHGVDPDIVVDNPPHETFNGRDAQLERAVKHLLEKIENDPREVPPAPPYPDKSFDYE